MTTKRPRTERKTSKLDSRAQAPYISLSGDGLNTFPTIGFKAEDVRAADIAYALARKPRFNGHLNAWWSVANHSILVMRLLRDRYGGNPVLERMGLWHDASEGYLPDVPTPFKDRIVGYRELEHELEAVIFPALGLPGLGDDRWAQVKWADQAALFLEATEFYDPHPPWVAACKDNPLSALKPAVVERIRGDMRELASMDPCPQEDALYMPDADRELRRQAKGKARP